MIGFVEGLLREAGPAGAGDSSTITGFAIFGLSAALLTLVAKVCPYELSVEPTDSSGYSCSSVVVLPYIAKQASRSSGQSSVSSDRIEFECERLSPMVMRSRAETFLALQNQRRSIRFMSQESFALDILLSCIATGGCAPSGK